MAAKNPIPSQLHDSVGSRVTIVNADASNYKDLIAVTGSDNSQETFLYSITLTSDDTSSRDLLFAIYDGTNTMEQGALTLGASTGFTVAAPPIQVIANRATPIISRLLKDANGNYFIPLRPGETLRVKSLTTVTSGKTIVAHCTGWKFTRS